MLKQAIPPFTLQQPTLKATFSVKAHLSAKAKKIPEKD